MTQAPAAEPSRYKRFIFNACGKPIYVSMYRKPFPAYARHLLKYKRLAGVFVELERHKDALVALGVPKQKIHVSATPAKVSRKDNTKEFDPNNVNILFASWNNKEGSPLQERGLIYLADLIKLNPHLTLTILLRDNKTKEFIELVNKLDVADRVSMVDVAEKDLEEMFDLADFVAFVIQKPVTKDVPNSLIDGLSRGKPVILSDVFGLSETVLREGIGHVIPQGTDASYMYFDAREYKTMSRRAYDFSKYHTTDNYVATIFRCYGSVQ